MEHLELCRVCLLGEEAIVLHNPLRENVLTQALDESGYSFARQLLVCQLHAKVVGAALRRDTSFDFLADIHPRLLSGPLESQSGWMRRRASLEEEGMEWLAVAKPHKTQNKPSSPEQSSTIASHLCFNIVSHLGLLGHDSLSRVRGLQTPTGF
jgi:hypothetical protein